MKRWRSLAGLLLVIIAISGLVFWEAKGREAVMLDTVAVASEKIIAGTVITRDHLQPAGIPEANKIYKAVEWNRLPSVLGCITTQDIVKNAQISKDYLAENDFILRGTQSIYVLDSDWIKMRSSSIRRGDWIDVYDSINQDKVGTYRVAFVKDTNEIEVMDGEGKPVTNPLNRVISSSVVDHVEIIADISDYRRILACISDGEAGLFLVQKGAGLQ